MMRVTKRNNKQSAFCCWYNDNYHFQIITISSLLPPLSSYDKNIVVVNATMFNRWGTVLLFISNDNISNNTKQHNYFKKEL